MTVSNHTQSYNYTLEDMVGLYAQLAHLLGPDP